MSIIKIEGLSFAYPGSADNVFENLNLQLDSDWRLGFVGRNGRGKTTLLRLLMGELEYSGRISSNLEFDYFPCRVNNSERSTLEILRERSGGEDWQLSREFSRLAMGDELLDRPFASLSQGEQTKAMLAALFINQDRFMLIDEPTNHLDGEARRLVAKWLAGKKSYILVSHDRSFLDGCVDHILSMNRAGAEIQRGNFSSYLENFQRQQDFEFEQRSRLQKDIRRMEQAAGRTAQWSDRVEASKKGAADKGYVGHKAAKMMKRSKAIEARQQSAMEQKSRLLKNYESADELKLRPLDYRSRLLAEFRDVTVSYDGRQVCRPVSFTLERGERIALSGGNGSGKSSLLKLLFENPPEHSGTVVLGSGLVISCVPQTAEGLGGSMSGFAKARGIDESLFKAVLDKMGVSRNQFEKDIAELSAGQKKKLLLAGSLCQQAHLYVWDEPLNYIDIYSRMQIQSLIERFAPSMLFVEHDRAFRDSIATREIRL